MSQYLIERIEQLKAENEQLRKERDAAKNMLEFEQSKHDHQLRTLEESLAERLANDIRLELQAIREIADYVDGKDKNRLVRRVNCIEECLSRFQNNEI